MYSRTAVPIAADAGVETEGVAVLEPVLDSFEDLRDATVWHRAADGE